jgi:hypothetical protein
MLIELRGMHNAMISRLGIAPFRNIGGLTTAYKIFKFWNPSPLEILILGCNILTDRWRKRRF